LKVNRFFRLIKKKQHLFNLENESGEELEEEQISGKKKVITIPLRFKPIELQRGSAGSRGGQRRGGNRYRSNRDEPRCKYSKKNFLILRIKFFI